VEQKIWRKSCFQFRASLGSIVSLLIGTAMLQALTNSGNSPVPPSANIFLLFFWLLVSGLMTFGATGSLQVFLPGSFHFFES